MSELAVITVADLRTLVREATAEAVREALAERSATERYPEYLTLRDLMELTGFDRRQVEYRRQKKGLPYLRRGGTFLYPRDAVLAWIEEGAVNSRGAA